MTGPTKTPGQVLRSAADFVARVRGDEDEYDDEYIRGYDEAVDLVRKLADRQDAQQAATTGDRS